MPRALINAFNAGELSPALDARVDVDKFKNGCRILENIIPKIQGGAFGRAGFEYMGAARYPDKKTQLIPFTFSTTTTFILEFGDGYLRFWSNGQQVLSGGLPYTVASPFAESDLFALQFAQVNDVMYIVSGTHPVQKLTRLADDNWTLAAVDWKFPALQDENVSTTTIAASATTGAVTLTASAALFDPAHVGAYFQLSHRRNNAYAELALSSTAASSSVRILGKYDVFTYGDWSGTLNLERKNALGNWEVIRTWKGSKDRNIVSSGTQDEEGEMRLNFTLTSSAGSNPPRATLEPADSRVYGLVKVTGYTDSTHVTGTVVATIWDTSATLYWSEGAWSDKAGHPRTVTIDQQRLVFGGTAKQPLTIWGSVIGDFENFKRTTLADAAYAFQIASPKGNSIVWMASQTRFFVGTQGDEWLIEASAGSTSNGSTGTVITSGNVNIQLQTSYGSAYVQPVGVSDSLMFVQRGRRKIREFVFQFDRQAFNAPDLNLLADHILANTTVRQLAFAGNPDPVVWIVSEDGHLFTMTFERDQNVVGWSRHITDGTVESVATIYGATGFADEVWIVAVRTIKDADTGADKTVRYLERLDPAKWSKLESGDASHFIYLDSAKVVTLGSPDVTVTGLDHLEGKTVSVLADGFVHPQRIVRNGAISLQTAATVIVAGLPFTPRLQASKLDVPLADGTAQGRKFHSCQATLRFWKSGAAQQADGPDAKFYDIPFRDAATPLNQPQPLFTGDKRCILSSRYRNSLDITLRQSQPLPFHVLSLSPIFEVTGQ